jgi:hypothetical protein
VSFSKTYEVARGADNGIYRQHGKISWHTLFSLFFFSLSTKCPGSSPPTVQPRVCRQSLTSWTPGSWRFWQRLYGSFALAGERVLYSHGPEILSMLKFLSGCEDHPCLICNLFSVLRPRNI